MDYVWELIAPYVAALGGATGASAIIYAIVRLLMGRFVKKTNATLDASYNAEKVSQLMAEKLAGKTMNIDVTAVTEKSLKKTAKLLDSRVERVEEATNALKGILVAIAKGIIKLKALSEDEKAELADAIKLLESGYTPPEPDKIMTVVLQPVELPEETESAGEAGDEPPAGVNFNGLEG